MRRWGMAFWLILFAVAAQAQELDRGLVAYWNFDESGIMGTTGKSKALQRASAQYAVGKRGMGMQLAGNSDYLEVIDSPKLSPDFSIALWFKPDNPASYQSLLFQYQTVGNELKMLYELSLQDQTVSFSLGANYDFTVTLPKYIIETNGWHFVFVGVSNRKLTLSLGTPRAMYSEHINVTDLYGSANYQQLLIGMGNNVNSLFTGSVDEIMYYNRLLSQVEREALHRGDHPMGLVMDEGEVLEAQIDKLELNTSQTINIQAQPNPQKTLSPQEKAKELLTTKRLYVQDSALAHHQNYVLEIWDYEIFDNDTVSVFLNDSLIIANMQTPPKKLAKLIPIQLKANRNNTITFVAMNKGKGGGNTSAVKIWNDHEGLMKCKLTITPLTNAAIKIKHLGLDLANTVVQKRIEVEHTSLTMEVWDKSLEDHDFVSVYCNGDTLLNYHELSNESVRIPLNLYKNHLNQIIFVAEDAGTIGQNTARVRIYNGEKILDDFSVRSTYKKNSAINIQTISVEKRAEHEKELKQLPHQ